MRDKRIIVVVIFVFILVFSCKKEQIKNVKKETLSHKKYNNTPNLKEQEKLIRDIFFKIQRVSHSKNMNEILSEYEKKDSTYWIEGAEDLITKEKIIYFGRSYHDKNNERNNYFLSLFLSNKNNISLVTSHIYKQSNGKDINEVKDTFFFKNNKIYFWKNKQASKEELIKKEKEILAIKKEIDSIMEW